MDSANVNSKIIQGYLSLLKNLDASNKLDLISKLTLSLKTEKKENNNFYKSFGAWETEESAEELIEIIRKSRNSNRIIEKF